MEKYLLIPVTGKKVWVDLDEDKLLEGFRQILDCDLIETVAVSSRFGLIVDEEGKLKSPPKAYNAEASLLLGDFSADFIAGDAILFAYGTRDGEPDITSPEGLL